MNFSIKIQKLTSLILFSLKNDKNILSYIMKYMIKL